MFLWKLSALLFLVLIALPLVYSAKILSLKTGATTKAVNTCSIDCDGTTVVLFSVTSGTCNIAFTGTCEIGQQLVLITIAGGGTVTLQAANVLGGSAKSASVANKVATIVHTGSSVWAMVGLGATNAWA